MATAHLIGHREIGGPENRGKATVYAINTLLIHKGIYTQEEFQKRFVEWVTKEQRRKVHRGY